jgi:hypothetical protein
MTVLVAALGVIFIGIGLMILAWPQSARWSLENMITRRMMPLYSIVRIGFGIALVLAAPSSRLPGFVWTFGLLLIFSGVALPIVGFEQIKTWSAWWLEKPGGAIRGWSLLVILLGALLLWAAT